MSQSKIEKIKICIAFIIVALIITVVSTILLKYKLEGETNMPFKLSKINVISTAEGKANIDAQEKWNLQIYQNNDIYFTIEKNEKNKKEEKIENVKIENIQITKVPSKGQIKAYMPNSSEGRIFTYEDESIIENNTLTYKGGTKTDLTKLEIGNQGGTIVLSLTNTDLGTYISQEDKEIKHDGTMLNKINIKNDELKFNVSFDIIINVKNKSYKTTVNLELPIGNIVEEGRQSSEIKDNYIFKRQ